VALLRMGVSSIEPKKDTSRGLACVLAGSCTSASMSTGSPGPGFFRDDATGGWQRVEPWMSTFVNTDTGQVLGIVNGRNSTGIQDWLDARTEAWRDGVEVVAIDPSATFRAAIETALPHTRISVDHLHLVRLANLVVTKVHQRVARETKGHRGPQGRPRGGPTACCSCAGDNLSERAVRRKVTGLPTDSTTRWSTLSGAVEPSAQRASPGGMQIWDIRTGDNTRSVPGFMSSRYHAASHDLASLDGSIRRSWQAC
jgi:hypothetical protein